MRAIINLILYVVRKVSWRCANFNNVFSYQTPRHNYTNFRLIVWVSAMFLSHIFWMDGGLDYSKSIQNTIRRSFLLSFYMLDICINHLFQNFMKHNITTLHILQPRFSCTTNVNYFLSFEIGDRLHIIGCINKWLNFFLFSV